MKKYLIFLVILFLLTSCKTVETIIKEVPVVEVHTEYKDKFIYDSVYLHDSTFIYVKGDTIYKYKDRVRTQYLYKTDTLTLCDSIPVPVEVKQIQYDHSMNWYQRFFFVIGIICFLTFAIWLTRTIINKK